MLTKNGEQLSGEERVLLEDAYAFAAKAHEGMVRKGTALPYIVHPMETAELVAQLTDDVKVIAAAVLHDVIEDCGVTKDKLELIFGRRVAQLVADESEDKRPHMSKEASWKIRKEETLAHIASGSRQQRIIAMCDKISNLRSTRNDYLKMGDDVWLRFNQKDKKMHAWYYWSIAKLTEEEFGHTALWQEFVGMCMQVYGSPDGYDWELPA